LRAQAAEVGAGLDDPDSWPKSGDSIGVRWYVLADNLCPSGEGDFMRPSTCSLVVACGLTLIACETYKADEPPPTGDESAAAADNSAQGTAAAPAAATDSKPAADTAGIAPTCDEVVAHLAAITEKQLANLSENERQQAAAVLPMVKAQVTEACNSSNWSGAFKRCIVAATTQEALSACERLAPPPEATNVIAVPPDQKAKPAQGAAPAAGGAAGPACGKVVDHVIEVALNAPDIPAEQREQMKSVLPQQKKAMLEACDKAPWPEPVRTCLLASKNATDIQGCRTAGAPH